MNVAVVGAGVMGLRHARTLVDVSNARLVAIVDPNEQVGRPVADDLDVLYLPTIEDVQARRW